MDNIGPWIFATACLLVIGALIYKWPKRTLISLGAILVLVVGGGGIALWVSSSQHAARLERARNLIEVNELSMDDWRLTMGSAYSTLSGTIHNRSEYPLQSLKVRVTIHQCPNGESCPAVGEKDVFIWTAIPPGQIRQIDEMVAFTSLPELTAGQWKWLMDVEEIVADVD